MPAEKEFPKNGAKKALFLGIEEGKRMQAKLASAKIVGEVMVCSGHRNKTARVFGQNILPERAMICKRQTERIEERLRRGEA